MEQFRKKLQFENLVLAIVCVILAGFMVLAFAGETGELPITPMAGDSSWRSQWRGFCAGASAGLLALMAVRLVRNLLAMKSPEKLKKLHIRQNDEREWEIYTKAMCAAMRLFLVLCLAAVVVVGYFNVTAGLTLLVTVASASFLGLGFKCYYRRKL